MTLLSVPVIDIAPYWTGGERGKREVAAAMDRACRDIGFLVISGHGVSPELVEETRDLTRAPFLTCRSMKNCASHNPRRTSRAAIHRSKAKRWHGHAVTQPPLAISMKASWSARSMRWMVPMRRLRRRGSISRPTYGLTVRRSCGRYSPAITGR